MAELNIIKLRVSAEFKAEVESAAEELQLGTSAFTRLALSEFMRERRAADPSGTAARAAGVDSTGSAKGKESA
tara:strand:+ start:738 stop:956 length:219 start_codon:yes stop_codon:yes gene_type:complete